MKPIGVSIPGRQTRDRDTTVSPRTCSAPADVVCRAGEREVETDFDGPLSVTRAFAPTLASNGGGAIVNVLSVRSWPHALAFGAYNAAKTAASGMANVVRQELVPRGIHVAALHLRSMDTDIVADVAAPRADPDAVAVPTLGGIEADLTEILADDLTRSVQQGIAAPPASRV